MAPPSPARISIGILLGAAGAALLVAGLMRAPFLGAAGGPATGPVAADVVGGVLLFVGLLVSLSQTRPRGPPVSVPAHVAFNSRAPQRPIVPPLRAEPVAREATPADDHHRALAKLDEEIRAVTKRINKASVMLATGKLSNEGYKSYVEELKRQRGELEVSRVQLELRKRQ
jgi:hypothetical protein